jgi:energy-converting hydrogenase Eha subunit F
VRLFGPNPPFSLVFPQVQSRWHHIFYFIVKPKTIMDLLTIVLAFLLAYGIFVLVAMKLARIFFPKVIDDEALELKTRTVRRRHPKRAAA